MHTAVHIQHLLEAMKSQLGNDVFKCNVHNTIPFKKLVATQGLEFDYKSAPYLPWAFEALKTNGWTKANESVSFYTIDALETNRIQDDPEQLELNVIQEWFEKTKGSSDMILTKVECILNNSNQS